MQFQNAPPAQQMISEQARIEAWAAKKRLEKRSRRMVGTAPTRPLPSRVSRKGLPCPEVHDTPSCAADPFPSPEVADEDDFDGFITVDNARDRAERMRRQQRRMRARMERDQMEHARTIEA